ncbi:MULTISPECIES: family 16 glycosylhydrolase [unclassified Mesorhizobium]|uniref:family 16 glycosylhydrolase n=1 Tax=unclassified Mesorhizobium TaxID=325217 RepID=UPI000FD41324|nr:MULTISPECIES: family 16 glycosylhydrolase [unclassified Mesorhizobium]RUV94238.1 glycosyl hydrolase family protein [Mesorhizobium sp. M5C.F.Ca.IN.020.14.1.1]RUV30981.1 glycosyl hydrolase family protein [Mesorhizobium sp. M5C.F.Ca.IN.020.32.2.1]RWD48208.1 MAG: glycosyl hydrolase family protein [Mesorhizobium sp.]RWE58516.1 MAG: glycosyl hydrolase family protein [Mesorhizobium sp.]RWE84170.1 MAG: glycosyl hydrolase family protein [Mesorhizobium sp.]
MSRALAMRGVEFLFSTPKKDHGMALSAPTGFASSDLVFEDNFSGTALDSDWHTYITSNAANGWPWDSNGSGGSGMGNRFNAEYNMPSQDKVGNGLLNLTAIKQPVNGVAQGSAYTFPVTSGVVSSYGNFEFNGGYLQISMKAPSGDGAWPALWLMPGKGAGSSGDNFEIDIQEGGFTGSGPANQAFSYHLHGPSGVTGGVVDSGVDLTAGFHTYGINWDPGKSITWYLDGKQMAQVTSAQAQIPNQPMELIMSNQVANSNAAGWHTALNSSTPSSMQMQIDEIQLYQKAGSGDTVTGANVTPPTTGAIGTETGSGTGTVLPPGGTSDGTLYGTSGADVLRETGAHTMIGYGGNDDYYVDNAGDKVVESSGQGQDRVWTSVSYALSAGLSIEVLGTTKDAGTTAINLTGNGLAQTIQGNAGANVINGRGGADKLSGFGGNDTFVFNSALGNGNVDRITDFNQDKIHLDDAIFAGLHLGGLPSAAFFAGTAAHDSSDHIIYNSSTGALSFDSDGAGGASQTQFATLSPHLSLTAASFYVT